MKALQREWHIDTLARTYSVVHPQRATCISCGDVRVPSETQASVRKQFFLRSKHVVDQSGGHHSCLD